MPLGQSLPAVLSCHSVHSHAACSQRGAALHHRALRVPSACCLQILESEGQRQSKINVAEASKSEVGGRR